MVISEVFSRLSGDNTAPAIHRLETAFGGGKTHTLIACTHLAYKGKEAAGFVGDIINEDQLPNPGEISVAAVAGDEISVQKPKGTRLVPYTLWGEIAFQLGGEALYGQVEEDAVSPAAPGKNYFETVFEDRKVLLMVDELAQYAARLSAAMPDGGNQLAAFLMSLHGYTRTRSGMAILLTLGQFRRCLCQSDGALGETPVRCDGKRDLQRCGPGHWSAGGRRYRQRRGAGRNGGRSGSARRDIPSVGKAAV